MICFLEMFDELFPTESAVLKRSRKARFSDNLEKKESIRQGIQIVLQNIDAERYKNSNTLPIRLLSYLILP